VGAVVLNVTVTSTSADSFLTLFPSGSGRPFTSNLNWNAGTTIANLVTVRVGSNGRVSIFNHAGTAHVIVDVMGFYATSDGPASLRLTRQDGKTIADLSLRKPPVATAGFLPKPEQGRQR